MATAQQNYTLTADPLSLDRIRSILNRLEDTIIFGLIERAQFAHNIKIYRHGEFEELQSIGFKGSWLEWFLKETESFHAKARRYTSPDEYPFTDPVELPKPVLKGVELPKILYPNNVNANASILSFYTHSIVPRITADLGAGKPASGPAGDEFEDDGNYGSAAVLDVEVLGAISKRVHYGKFVSESKFRANPAAFVPHILNPNRAALDALITKPEVERKLLQRLRKKAEVYALNFSPEGEPSGEVARKIDVDAIVDLYEHHIIPLTKEVEVDYLLVRLDGMSQEEIEELATRKGV